MIQEIQQALPNEIIIQLDDIINRIHFNGPINVADFEKLALIKLFHPEIFATRESELLYLAGLFYKVCRPQNVLEEVYSIFADSIYEETGKKFTPVQADAYHKINTKQFFSFSAPTSAGKSFLFRELIIDATGDIVIVVPSRALIAEYLNVIKGLVDKSVLVLQFIDNINIANTSRRVFVITPERGRELFRYKMQFNIELFLFDEAQLSEEEIRGIGFDAFVRRVSLEFPVATKVFAHPFVQNPEAQLIKHSFDSENRAAINYEQNTVGKVFLAAEENKLYFFSPYNKNKERVLLQYDPIKEILEKNGTILIYTSKAKLYSRQYLSEYKHYLRYCPKLTDASALKYIEQVRNYIGATKEKGQKKSLIVSLMERGIVIHHGSMPLKMRLIIENFVRNNHAKLCFATSTLQQGINMPFDAVFIDNYTRMDVLTLKNLIGRSGRTTSTANLFDIGYTIIHEKNVKSFCKRINEQFVLKDTSPLDNDFEYLDEDNYDLVEAIKENSFDDQTRLTNVQIERLKSDSVIVNKSINCILNLLFIGDRILNGKEYYEHLSEAQRTKIKEAFKTIYISHLRRTELTSVEQAILSTAIPILLWQIQGKTFKEILGLRHAYLTKKSERLQIYSRVRANKISDLEGEQELKQLKVRFSQAPSALPNIRAIRYSDFKNVPVLDLDYDTLVFDTYDYLDKVISLSLADPLCAAFKLYYERSEDKRAKSMENYIRYGTDDAVEIWLLRYGFAFEDIKWIKPYVQEIDEQKITFLPTYIDLAEDQLDIISRYV